MLKSKKKKWLSLVGSALTVSLAIAAPLSALGEDASDVSDAATQVKISEIESNDASGGSDWIEIMNTGTAEADISGWYVTDDMGQKRVADQKTTPLAQGTILKPGQVLVLEEGINFDFGLGKADTATLFDAQNTQKDTYSWTKHAKGTYQLQPDGSFADKEPTKGQPNQGLEPSESSDQSSDESSQESSQTPESSDTSDSSESSETSEPAGSTSLFINEINSSPDDWVEIINTGDSTADLSGWEIRDNSDDHRFKIADGTTLEAGALYLVKADTKGLVFDDQSGQYVEGNFDEAIGIGSGDSIRLYDTQGQLRDSYSWTKHASYNGDYAAASYGRYPDGTGSFTLMPETPGAANGWYAPEVVINEVESNGDATDWVEIYNKGSEDVDISGWYLYDNDPVGHKNDITPVPEGTILKAGGWYVFDQNQNFTFGLGKDDSATIYTKDGLTADSYAWTSHANGTYARIPDGTGPLVDTAVPTKGTANTQGPKQPDQPDKPDLKPWPGSDQVTTSDLTFLEDASGLDFANGQLYAADNGTGKFWVLNVAKDGSLSFAPGFEKGKTVNFMTPTAKGPDTEGITVDGDGYVYLASERDNSNKGVNYDTILKADSNGAETQTALMQWDITSLLPQVSANADIEAVEWVPFSAVNGKLYDDTTKAPFDSSNYPDASAGGIFFTALEENGHVYGFTLNNDGSATRVCDIDSTIGGAMALDYDAYDGILWVAADDGFGNVTAQIRFNGTDKPDITLLAPAAGIDVTRNNDGFAIATEDYTVNGQRPVYHFADGFASGQLTIGSIDCQAVPSKPEESSKETSSESSKPEESSKQEQSSQAQESSQTQESSDTGKSQVQNSSNSQTVSGVPKTGDHSDPVIWSVILIAGSACAAASLALRRKHPAD